MTALPACALSGALRMKTILLLVAGLVLPLLQPNAWAQTAASPLQPEPLHAFTAGITDFYNSVVPGPGGDFFGVSRLGGKFNRGAFFSITSAGVVTKLADFGDPESQARGWHPSGRLLFDGSTYFYGVTQDGGRFGEGTIFRVDAAGNVTTLVDFSGSSGVAPGGSPFAGLTAGQDGNLYGVAYGGSLHNGVIFRTSPSGRYEVLVTFTGEGGEAPGDGPSSPLAALANGSFVGTTSSGGRSDHGVVFRFSPQGGYSVAGEFTGPSGALPGSYPYGELTVGLDGTVYGSIYVSITGGTDSGQRLWKLPPTGNAVPFVSLQTDSNGQSLSVYYQSLGVLPSGDLVGVGGLEAYSYNSGLYRVTPAGQIYPFEDFGNLGLTQYYGYYYNGSSGLISDNAGGLVFGFGRSIARRSPTGPTAILATTTPDAGTGEGVSPIGNVLVAPDGTVFGQNVRGGATDQGTIFSLPTSGPLNTLLSVNNSYYYDYYYYDEGSGFYFDNANQLGLIGNDLLYVDPYNGTNYSGVIQRITAAGVASTVAEFGSVTGPPSGYLGNPQGGLTPDGLGNFYGRASFTDDANFETSDAVFRLTSGNALELVARVPKFSTAQYPPSSYGPLTRDAAGNFLGNIPFGGSKSDGLIYKVTPGGQITKFFEFGQPGDATNSSGPAAPFLLESSGSVLIPMRYVDGSDIESSLVRLSIAGTPTRVLAFTREDGAAPGENPLAPLVRDPSGRIYGATRQGGRNDAGVLYRLETNNTYTLLHEFTVGSDPADVGTAPSTGLAISADGAYIYGATFSGGEHGGGTIFRFPTSVQATATTQAAADVTPNSATFKAMLDSNGYGGSFYFAFGESAGTLDRQTAVQAFGGFNGSRGIDVEFDALKGHRTYYVQFNATVGASTDTITRQGTTVSFFTPNGTPRAANDTVIVTAATGDFAGEVLANDIEPDDDPLTIDSFGQGAYGAVTQAGNTLVYTPTQAFFDNGGRDSFTYTIRDDQTPALMATATVDVLSDVSISGDYAGLLFEEEPAAANIPREAQAIPSSNEIAAGFATFALGRARKFTARFQVGTRNVAVKGTMQEGRGTRVAQSRSRFDGELRATPGGVEGRITIDGRTLVLRMGQAFAAAQGIERPASDFTMRLSPTRVENPVNAAGLPAGSGFAIVRELKRSRVLLVGVLPDGTAFSKKTVVNGDKQVDFFTTLYKDKSGSLAGQLTLDDSGHIDPAVGTSTLWEKSPRSRDTRFAGGFSTTMTAFGGKYTIPKRGEPALTVPAGDKLRATFDRGGLFSPLSTDFTFTGSKPVPDPITDSASAKVKFIARAGLVSGSFIPTRKPVKFRGVVVQRDKTVAGYFLGTADAGSVTMEVVD